MWGCRPAEPAKPSRPPEEPMCGSRSCFTQDLRSIEPFHVPVNDLNGRRPQLRLGREPHLHEYLAHGEVRILARSSSLFRGIGIKYCFCDKVNLPVAVFILTSFRLSLTPSCEVHDGREGDLNTMIARTAKATLIKSDQ